MGSEQGLPSMQMEQLQEEVRGVARRLSCDQVLDLADMLHEEIRARRSSRILRTAKRRRR